MTPNACFIQMDFVNHRFHIYFGDVNDPSTWVYQGHSFYNCIDAEDKMIELDTPPEP